MPPLHPRCRCAIKYEEEPLKTTGDCKTFSELKSYWAENYNVVMANSVSQLHFESVRAALEGVEAVLKEFPPAGFYLKELATLRDLSIMSTSRGHGRIYFNPDYFVDGELLKATLATGAASGFYPANMTVFGAGAHEAVHIVEDWLIKKYGEELSTRSTARRLLREAYARAILKPAGKGKSIYQLKREISIYATDRKISECLAEGATDFLINGSKAALLSREIWQRLKEELS